MLELNTKSSFIIWSSQLRESRQGTFFVLSENEHPAPGPTSGISANYLMCMGVLLAHMSVPCVRGAWGQKRASILLGLELWVGDRDWTPTAYDHLWFIEIPADYKMIYIRSRLCPSMPCSFSTSGLSRWGLSWLAVSKSCRYAWESF